MFLRSVAVPNVTVTPPLVATAGDNITITCTATVIENLSVPVTLQWINPCSIIGSTGNPHSTETERNGDVYSSSVRFTPIHTSHGGQYSCLASINVPGISSLESIGHTEVTVQSEFSILCSTL
jgi:hypothetical protein